MRRKTSQIRGSIMECEFLSSLASKVTGLILLQHSAWQKKFDEVCEQENLRFFRRAEGNARGLEL